MTPRSNVHALLLITAVITMAASAELAISFYNTPLKHSLDFENNSLRYIHFKHIYIFLKVRTS